MCPLKNFVAVVIRVPTVLVVSFSKNLFRPDYLAKNIFQGITLFKDECSGEVRRCYLDQ